MEEKLLSIYTEYYSSISAILSKLTMAEWILFSLAFVGILIKIPILFLVPFSALSYFALENEGFYEQLSKISPSISPEFMVLGIWVLAIFARLCVFKNKEENKNPKLVKNLVSFSFIFILSMAIGTPSFTNSQFKDLRYIIMFAILLYALFHICIHSIGLLKNVVITFAWGLIISILGMQLNPDNFASIFDQEKIEKIKEVQEEINTNTQNATDTMNNYYDEMN